MAGQSNLSVMPGPINPEVLFKYHNHRAFHIFNGTIEDKPLMIRRCDNRLWLLVDVIPDRVMAYIREAGFEGVLRCGRIQLDHALITALVERWRPETHTFHFPVGEATITLQDVSVLWGLRVDGLTVSLIDCTLEKSAWIMLCEEMMGFTPPEDSITDNSLKLSALYNTLRTQLPTDATDEMCLQRARSYIMYLLGGQLLSDLSSSRVSLRYLLHFAQDMQNSSNTSWGSAVLAYLYRRLCIATRPESMEICGSLVLLQLWAWERLPTIAPIRMSVEVDFTRPYAARWNVDRNVKRVPAHVLPAIRDQLASIRPDQFVWTPYPDELLAAVLGRCSAATETKWRCVTYMICQDVVEPHLPNRVMRQFGMFQPIPMPRLMEDHAAIHAVSRRGRPNCDWGTTHQKYITHFDLDNENVENGTMVTNTTYASAEYMTWYWERTVVYIVDPSRCRLLPDGYEGSGSQSEVLMDSLCRTFYRALDLMNISDATNREYFAEFRDIARNGMLVAKGEQRIEIPVSHLMSQSSNYSAMPATERRVSRKQVGIRRGGRNKIDHIPNQQMCPTNILPQIQEFSTPMQCGVEASEYPSNNDRTNEQNIEYASHLPIYNPIPFQDLTQVSPAFASAGPSEINLEVPQTECIYESHDDHVIVDDIIVLDDDEPLARRRGKRIIKKPKCGTH